MKNYSKCSDEELVERIQSGEKEIADYLITRYKNLVLSKVKSLFILGGDNDDLIQEGMIGLYKAIRDFDFSKDTKFSTYANICVTGQVLTAIEASQRKKHIPLNNYISLYGNDNSSEDNDNCLVNALSSMTDKSPEEIMMDRALVDEIDLLIATALSNLEAKALRLYLTGATLPEIAEVIGKNEKATDNALQRAKQKIRKGIEL